MGARYNINSVGGNLPSGRRKLTSVFCLRGKAVEYIRPGAIFRRIRADQTTETAEIVDVYSDPSGIPHFRYDLTFERPHWPAVREGQRVLSARTFFDQFSERLEAKLDRR